MYALLHVGDISHFIRQSNGNLLTCISLFLTQEQNDALDGHRSQQCTPSRFAAEIWHRGLILSRVPNRNLAIS